MRAIDEIIIHCTVTPEGREVSVAEIDSWHRQRGFNGIGYHYVIHLDGRLSRGRSVETPGAHCVNHNSRSIGVCYVGGTDRQGHAKDTRTKAQRQSLLKLCRELKQKYPKATIHGHNEFAAKACPSFDVQAWRKEVGL